MQNTTETHTIQWKSYPCLNIGFVALLKTLDRITKNICAENTTPVEETGRGPSNATPDEETLESVQNAPPVEKTMRKRLNAAPVEKAAKSELECDHR